jgi:predicted phage-related endonuclease
MTKKLNLKFPELFSEKIKSQTDNNSFGVKQDIKKPKWLETENNSMNL